MLERNPLKICDQEHRLILFYTQKRDNILICILPDKKLFDFFLPFPKSGARIRLKSVPINVIFKAVIAVYGCGCFHGSCCVWNVPIWKGAKLCDYTAELAEKESSENLQSVRSSEKHQTLIWTKHQIPQYIIAKKQLFTYFFLIIVILFSFNLWNLRMYNIYFSLRQERCFFFVFIFLKNKRVWLGKQ